MKVIVISYADLTYGVGYKTRILLMLEHLIKTNGPQNVEWINVVPGNLSGLRKCVSFGKEYKKLHIATSFIPRPMIPFIGPIYRLFFTLFLFAKYGNGKNIIMWCEMTSSGWLPLLYKKFFSVPLILDIHGTIDESVQFVDALTEKNIGIYSKQVFRELSIIANANGIIGVSNKMFHVYQSRYGNLFQNSCVIPCSVDSQKFYWQKDERDLWRKKLNLENKFVFIYSGGVLKWQCVDEMLSIFDKVREYFNRDNIETTFLFLTWDKNYSLPASLKEGDKDHKIQLLNVRQEDVKNYLQAADAGFILRQNLTTNIVSSPTKVGEYLSCGLPIICTEHVGDTSEIVEKNRVGYLIDLNGDSDVEGLFNWCKELMNERDEITKRCIRSANEYFSLTHLDKIELLLKQVSENAK